MKRRFLSVMLTLAMVLSILPTAALAATYSDVSAKHWAAEAIDRWSGYGIITGDQGKFRPDADMTRAEAAAVFARLLALTDDSAKKTFPDLTTKHWAYSVMNKAINAGILSGSDMGNVLPDAKLDRQTFFTMFARALGLKPQDTTSGLAADGDSWSSGYINALTDKGYIKGDGTSVNAKGKLTRASALKLLDQTVTTYANENGKTYEGTGKGVLLVTADNCTITGAVDMLVIAGGESGAGAVTKANADGSCSLVLAAGKREIKLVSATVKTLNIVTPKASLDIGAGSAVETVALTAQASDTDVAVAAGASVTAVETAAADTAISNSGVITTVTVEATATGAAVTAEKGSYTGVVETKAASTAVSGTGAVANVVASGSAASGTGAAKVETKGTKTATVDSTGKTTTKTTSGSLPAADSANAAAAATAATAATAAAAAAVTEAETEAKADSTTTPTTPSTGGGSGGGSSATASTLNISKAEKSFWGKDIVDFGEFAVATSGTTVTVTGTLYKISGWANFSSDTNYNTGYFLPLKVTKGNAPSEISSSATFSAKGSGDTYTYNAATFFGGGEGTDYASENGDTLVMLVGNDDKALTNFTLTIDWDGSGSAYSATTYTVNVSGATKGGAVTASKLAFAKPDLQTSDPYFGKALTDMVGNDYAVAIDSTNATKINVTGTIYEVKGWTEFDGANTALQSGYYVPLKITVPNSEPTATSVVTVDGSQTKVFESGAFFETPDYTSPTGNTLIMHRLPDNNGKLANFMVTIDWDGSGSAYAATTYTVDLSGAKTSATVPSEILTVSQVAPTATTADGNAALATAWSTASGKSASGNMTADTNDYHIGVWYAALTGLDSSKTYYLVREYQDQSGHTLAADWGTYSGVTEKFVFASWGMNLQNTSYQQLELKASISEISADVAQVKFTLTTTAPTGNAGSGLTTAQTLGWPSIASETALSNETYEVYPTVTINNAIASETVTRNGESVSYTSTTPVFSVATATMAGATATTVDFTLSSALSGTWKVYDSAEAAVTALTTVTASVSGTTLTLNLDAAPTAEETYYVTVTESGKEESAKSAALTVKPYAYNALQAKLTAAQTATEKTVSMTESVTVPNGQTLTIPEGVTLEVNGTLTVNGSVTVGGKITLSNSSTATVAALDNIGNGEIEITAGSSLALGEQNIFGTSTQTVGTELTAGTVTLALATSTVTFPSGAVAKIYGWPDDWKASIVDGATVTVASIESIANVAKPITVNAGGLLQLANSTPIVTNSEGATEGTYLSTGAVEIVFTDHSTGEGIMTFKNNATATIKGWPSSGWVAEVESGATVTCGGKTLNVGQNTWNGSGFVTISELNFGIATGTYFEKAASDLGSDLQAALDGNTVKITGTLNYIANYTKFSSDASEQSGFYLPLKITAPSTITNFSSATISVVGSKTYTNTDGTFFTAGDYKNEANKGETMVLLTNNSNGTLKNFTVTVDFDGSGTAYDPTVYTIDLSAVELAVPPDTTVTSLTVPEGKTLTVNGTLTIASGGTLTVNGTLVIGGTLTGAGTLKMGSKTCSITTTGNGKIETKVAVSDATDGNDEIKNLPVGVYALASGTAYGTIAPDQSEHNQMLAVFQAESGKSYVAQITTAGNDIVYNEVFKAEDDAKHFFYIAVGSGAAAANDDANAWGDSDWAKSTTPKFLLSNVGEAIADGKIYDWTNGSWNTTYTLTVKSCNATSIIAAPASKAELSNASSYSSDANWTQSVTATQEENTVSLAITSYLAVDSGTLADSTVLGRTMSAWNFGEGYAGFIVLQIAVPTGATSATYAGTNSAGTPSPWDVTDEKTIEMVFGVKSGYTANNDNLTRTITFNDTSNTQLTFKITALPTAS